MREKGFSLVELMIAVAIMGILAGVAYPSYTRHVIESRRADAQRVMVEYMQSLERYFTVNGSYANGGNCGVNLPTNPSMYALACAVNGGVATVTATSSGAQSTDGNLTLSTSGAKTPSDKWKM
ncbi:type IV pilin protein [Dechloromonas sp. ZS-1]|uniref:type IV pilin protein n=1 Tax=Dechloromonas sp. ZS-1 TaxID=3138067 RepID=UPI0031FC4A3E